MGRTATAIQSAAGQMDESVAAARRARLRYARDDRPGLARRGRGKSFTYWDANGRRIRDRATLERIRALVIPPAWRNVWICPLPDGHLQATGRDARGRKQYRYHARWREVRDELKYHHILDFARVLPDVRRRVRRDLRAAPLSRDRVLAIVVSLLERTLIRVGNEEYARTNGSYGLTTMQDRHAEVRGRRVRFRFRGKSGVFQHVEIEDPRLARDVRRCQELPGQTLFQYLDEAGARQVIDSGDINDYIHAIAGAEFTAKDFRTWAGTVLAGTALARLDRVGSLTARKKNIVRAIEAVAGCLGNTTAVCRKCYIHPAIIEAYLDDGATVPRLNGRAWGASSARLSRDERNVLSWLTRRLARASRDARRRAA